MIATKFPFIQNESNRKRALVTGGTAGIGKAIVSRLLDGGAEVITTARKMTYSNNEERGLYLFKRTSARQKDARK